MTANKETVNAEESRRQELEEDLLFFAKEIEHFETHDMSEELANAPEVHFEINLPPRRTHFSIEAALAAKLRETARQRGTSAETLLNEWVREKTAETETVGAAK